MGKIKRKGRGASKAPRKPSLDDRLQEEATVKAGEAMQLMLADLIKKNFNRPISTLTKRDIEWLAVSAISGWIQARAEQAKTYDDDVGKLIRDVEI
jgi:hypothetical protein